VLILFSSNVQNKEFVISKKAFKEVSDKIPECREWLQNSNVEIYSLTSTSLLIAKKSQILHKRKAYQKHSQALYAGMFLV
jgi:hypothetical protein